MPSIFGRLKIFVLLAVVAVGLALSFAPAFEKRALATSPPTMAWGTWTGSITGGGTGAVICTATTGARKIVQYANLAATGAGIVNLYEKTSSGTLIVIASADCAAAGTVEFKQNDYFGGTGWVTASGSSVVILVNSTLTVTGNVRFLEN